MRVLAAGYAYLNANIVPHTVGTHKLVVVDVAANASLTNETFVGFDPYLARLGGEPRLRVMRAEFPSICVARRQRSDGINPAGTAIR